MKKPQVFISSAYYDLNYIRNNLKQIISQMGYDLVFFESGDIAYEDDKALKKYKESAFIEIDNSHTQILIIGGRYGDTRYNSINSTDDQNLMYERFNSLIIAELERAIKKGIPIFIFVEGNLYIEYEIYERNPQTDSIIYPHVDNINIFKLLDKILSQKSDINIFDKFEDIESLLTKKLIQNGDKIQNEKPIAGNIHGASNDQTSKEDQLGFEPYAKAFAKLIESPYTFPPLTIGIYGSWGMGKSTLLEYIANEVSWPTHVIRFNAWEYSSTDAIWPGLIRKIMDHMEKEISIHGILDTYFIKLSRIIRRFWAYSLMLWLILFLIGFVAIKYQYNPTDIKSAFWGLGLSALVTIIIGVLNIWFSPLSNWMIFLFKDNKYGKQIGYMEEIRKDLNHLRNHLKQNHRVPQKYLVKSDITFSGEYTYKYNWGIPIENEVMIKERILIIIDDLDRCEPNKAVEVLQAINLLLNFDIFIICLGIDARIVTKAIERHYKDLLGKASVSGFEYIDKIIQLPFRIPDPSTEDIKNFILHQIDDCNKNNLVRYNYATPKYELIESKSILTGNVKDEGIRNEKLNMGNETGKILDYQNSFGKNSSQRNIESFSAFEMPEKEAFVKFVPFMRPNPRHLKRLINIYRLVRILAINKREKFILENPSSVIRWLLICGQWPYTAHRMLYWFEKSQNDQNTKKDKTINRDILKYLFMKSKSEIISDENKCRKRDKLDYKMNLLELLIEKSDDMMNDQELIIIRKYTINFNPAIEVELDSTNGV